MSDPLGKLAGTFAWLSLLQFGGTNAVVPEMHRQAVEVLHWMDAPLSRICSPWPSSRQDPTS